VQKRCFLEPLEQLVLEQVQFHALALEHSSQELGLAQVLLLFCCKQLKRLLTGTLIKVIFSCVDSLYIKINKKRVQKIAMNNYR
jgi:hypothetical protein